MEGFLQSLGNNFVSKDGIDDGSSLKSVQLIGIYFSAHWCPPCKSFTPILEKFYNEVNASGKVFEIVFATSDSDEEYFNEYFATMPWIAIPFGSKEIQNLKIKHGVSGIPKLVILKTDETVVSDNARGDVTNLGINAWSKWTA